MKADITRKTFRKEEHYRKVNMQQGRVQIDADWNEQVEIQVNHDRTILRDIIGTTGVPKENGGFEIIRSKKGYSISKGNYYVDGILCKNDNDIEATEQKDLPSSNENSAFPSVTGKYILYLDVWERHLTALEDPSIREVALGGADTATRTKDLWQVKWFALPEDFQVQGGDNACESAFSFLKEQLPQSDGGLKARAKTTQPIKDPCEMPPGSKYRRLENHLYRVEIHNGGKTGDGATFKWSRDNGIVVAKVNDIISGAAEHKIKVSSIGRDRVNLGFNGGQWIEITDDRRELWGLHGTIVQLVSAEDNELVFDPNTVKEGDLPITKENFANPDYNPKVRRWDSEYKDEASGLTSGVIPVTIPSSNGGYIELEDGVEIGFTEGKTYKTEDYWLIPARTTIGDIEWPNDESGPIERSIEGIVRHYAPLALIEYDASINTEEPESESPVKVISHCRRIFSAATDPILYYVSGDGQHGGAISELKYPLVVGVARGNVPAEGLLVTFEITKGEGELRNKEGNTSSTKLSISSDQSGLVECFWKLGGGGDQQVDAVLLVKNEVVHIPLKYNATIEQPRAAVTTANSGIIEIGITPGMNPLVGPFEHFLETETPPAILLGQVAPRDSETEPPRVMFMEDHYLYRSEIIGERFLLPGFKPVSITNKGFCIRLFDIRELQPEQRTTLIWWAIPAQLKDPQKYTPPHIEFEPTIVTIDNSMTLRVTDPAATNDVIKVNVIVKLVRGPDNDITILQTGEFEAKLPRNTGIGPEAFDAKVTASRSPGPPVFWTFAVGEDSIRVNPPAPNTRFLVEAIYAYMSCSARGGDLRAKAELRQS